MGKNDLYWAKILKVELDKKVGVTPHKILFMHHSKSLDGPPQVEEKIYFSKPKIVGKGELVVDSDGERILKTINKKIKELEKKGFIGVYESGHFQRPDKDFSKIDFSKLSQKEIKKLIS